MAIGLQLGTFHFQGAPPAPAGSGKCRLAVLGDFSGRASRRQLESGEALAQRKAQTVDVDNFEAVLRRQGLRLSLPLGGGRVEIPITSLDDFHPEQLYEKLPLFAELSGLRQRLKTRSLFAKAAAEVQTWAGLAPLPAPTPEARANTVPAGEMDDFARLLGGEPVATPLSSPISELIKQLVAPHVVPAKDPREAPLVAAVDAALSAAMRSVLHHPEFQAAEALWRSIDLLTRRLETGPTLQLVLIDLTAEELAADLATTGPLEQTALYRLLVEQPALDVDHGPFAAVVATYTFARTRAHASLLARAVQVTALSSTAFIAAITPAVLEEKSEELPGEVRSAWSDLAAHPAAAYLALATPGFLLRHPYGEGSDPVDCFDFEEVLPSKTEPPRGQFLWANPAVLVGLLIGLTYTKQPKAMELGTVLSIGELPTFVYEDRDGDQVAMPCTERQLTSQQAAALTAQGFLPLLSRKGSPEVRLGGFHSLHGPTLAGPWAPAVVPLATGAPAPSIPGAVEAKENAPAAENTAAADPELESLLAGLEEPAPAPTADAELDALFSSLEEAPAPADPGASAAPPEEAGDPELDALFAGLEPEPATAPALAPDSSGDGELDALLAGLGSTSEGEPPADDDTALDSALAELLNGPDEPSAP